MRMGMDAWAHGCGVFVFFIAISFFIDFPFVMNLPRHKASPQSRISGFVARRSLKLKFAMMNYCDDEKMN
ncbi:MAG: hypothetical protein FWE59_02510 [Oscillospiraceae bacterium]|nr:hypothetical protein [Oscillospiraceae bacterium]